MKSFNKVDCSQSPIFCKIVETERFALRAVILDECCLYYSGGAGQFGRKRFTPRRPSPGCIFETKMAVRTAKRAILTILQKTGYCEQSTNNVKVKILICKITKCQIKDNRNKLLFNNFHMIAWSQRRILFTGPRT